MFLDKARVDRLNGLNITFYKFVIKNKNKNDFIYTIHILLVQPVQPVVYSIYMYYYNIQLVQPVVYSIYICNIYPFFIHLIETYKNL